ncbi:MAG: hypothetical protein WC137_01410 [Alphaproteobacteria bacterium]
MRKILGFIGFFAITSLFVISVNAASAPNSRGDVARATTISNGGISANTSRMPTMTAGMGGVIGSNLGGNTTANVTACTPGAIRSCTTTAGQEGTQTCNASGTWGACVASYNIDDCMDALLACVNGGALEEGIAGMYDENIRNAIINGMGLCTTVIDKCIANIAVYHSASDVWIDFNSRVVQPQYYNFVLRKTGLTPNQAENTCLLLDKNVYGKSFAAVGAQDEVQGEYAQGIGAYNNANNGSISKTNPQGPDINAQAYDANRGHYARWNATDAECLVRVAAYNKDDLITNKWLGIGNDEAAEVWKSTGSSFTCNKSLFEFGLMNKTKKTAVLSGTIGAVVGAGTGALIGHAKDKKEALMTYCDDEDNLLKMNQELSDNTARAIVNEYLGGPIASGSVGNSKDGPVRISTVLKTGEKIDTKTCKKVQDLYNSYQQWKVVTISSGTAHPNLPTIVEYCPDCKVLDACNTTKKAGQNTYSALYTQSGGAVLYCSLLNTAKKTMETAANKVENNACQNLITGYQQFIETIGCEGDDSDAWTNRSRADGKQSFKNPNRMYSNFNAEVYCAAEEKDCITSKEFKKQVERLGSVLETLEIANEVEEKGMSKAGKGALIGAGAGIVAGGLTTAITAFVEKNNINCRVGDGLDRIAMGKSGTIDTLKEYYTKWALNLPDVLAPTPTSTVADCASWGAACATIANVSDCVTAGINYLPAGGITSELVYNACAINPTSGLCQANIPVATSHGACP